MLSGRQTEQLILLSDPVQSPRLWQASGSQGWARANQTAPCRAALFHPSAPLWGRAPPPPPFSSSSPYPPLLSPSHTPPHSSCWILMLQHHFTHPLPLLQAPSHTHTHTHTHTQTQTHKYRNAEGKECSGGTAVIGIIMRYFPGEHWWSERGDATWGQPDMPKRVRACVRACVNVSVRPHMVRFNRDGMGRHQWEKQVTYTDPVSINQKKSVRVPLQVCVVVCSSCGDVWSCEMYALRQ